jgi:phenylpropionate dioxygenase-like ring-hydroxylating dioxygenase large terminal subunit
LATAEAAPPIDFRELIKADRIHGRLYRDPAIFDSEMEEIWHKGWVYVGHESEVPRNGDFVRRQIGQQPVILVRSDDGKLRIFYNRCRHRANIVCHHERGNAPVLKCAYHGWTYSNDGALIAPTFDEAYDPSLRGVDFALVEIGRVNSYRGLIFGSLAAGGISLKQHLGQATQFLDQVLDRSPVGTVELTAGTHRLVYRGNWKLLPENSLEGGYHGHFIHKFAFDLTDRRTGRDRQHELHEDAILYLAGGHMIEDFSCVKAEPRKTLSEERKAYAAKLEAKHGKAHGTQLAFGRPPILYVFPNLLYVQTHFRRLQPISPRETHVYYQPALLHDVPQEINLELLRHHEGYYGPAGFLAPDDLEVLERSQVGIEALGDDWLFLGRGIHREKPRPDGGSSGVSMDENHLRGMWHHYREVMSAA